MADALKGAEFRVFRSLFQEADFDTVEKIRMHLTQGPAVETAAIETVLESLAASRYVEEHKPGHLANHIARTCGTEIPTRRIEKLIVYPEESGVIGGHDTPHDDKEAQAAL